MRARGAKRRSSAGAAGFTIVEVMVAIMILAVALVSIFGAQFSAIATSNFARHSTMAAQLARCRMSEIELGIQVENGFQEADVTENGPCCEFLEDEESTKEFTCSWSIEAVELPDMTSMLTGGGDGTDPDADGVGGAGLLGDFKVGETQEGGGDMAGGILESFGPMLSDMLKQAIRRVTVQVEWQQGSITRKYEIRQYLTHPSQGPLELFMKTTPEEAFGDEPTGEVRF